MNAHLFEMDLMRQRILKYFEAQTKCMDRVQPWHITVCTSLFCTSNSQWFGSLTVELCSSVWVCMCIRLGNERVVSICTKANKIQWLMALVIVRSKFLVYFKFSQKIIFNSFLLCFVLQFDKCNYIQGHVSPSPISSSFCS